MAQTASRHVMECKHSRAKSYALRASPTLPRLREPQPFQGGLIGLYAGAHHASGCEGRAPCAGRAAAFWRSCNTSEKQ